MPHLNSVPAGIPGSPPRSAEPAGQTTSANALARAKLINCYKATCARRAWRVVKSIRISPGPLEASSS